MHQFSDPEATLEDIMALPGDSKAELIHGKIHIRTPPSEKHSKICANLIEQICSQSRARSHGEVLV
ncbi:MAG: Uma2 family endonuclease [Deltaproteobacteria bacterium]|nr:Uma2 family endonuclease [Deltaproteobacteria bacterium]